MKKIILATLFTAIVGNIAFGQGEVVLANSSTSTTKIFTNNISNGQSTGQSGFAMPGSATAGYTFVLFVNTATNATGGVPSGLSSSATPWTGAGGWQLASFGGNGGDYAINGSLSGRIQGVDNGGSFAQIAGFGVGINANLELVGWNTAIGGSTLTSFTTAYNGQTAGLIYGYSGVANITLGDNGATVVNTGLFVAPSSGGITGFTLAPIAAAPEPSTMALAALGGASLLLFRRRK